eukprot:43662_1
MCYIQLCDLMMSALIFAINTQRGDCSCCTSDNPPYCITYDGHTARYEYAGEYGYNTCETWCEMFESTDYLLRYQDHTWFITEQGESSTLTSCTEQILDDCSFVEAPGDECASMKTDAAERDGFIIGIVVSIIVVIIGMS